jgi:hypothetical protein
MICQKVRPYIFECLARYYEANTTITGAFYMVGDIESARAKGEKILAELEGK